MRPCLAKKKKCIIENEWSKNMHDIDVCTCFCTPIIVSLSTRIPFYLPMVWQRSILAHHRFVFIGIFRIRIRTATSPIIPMVLTIQRTLMIHIPLVWTTRIPQVFDLFKRIWIGFAVTVFMVIVTLGKHFFFLRFHLLDCRFFGNDASFGKSSS